MLCLHAQVCYKAALCNAKTGTVLWDHRQHKTWFSSTSREPKSHSHCSFWTGRPQRSIKAVHSMAEKTVENGIMQPASRWRAVKVRRGQPAGLLHVPWWHQWGNDAPAALSSTAWPGKVTESMNGQASVAASTGKWQIMEMGDRTAVPQGKYNNRTYLDYTLNLVYKNFQRIIIIFSLPNTRFRNLFNRSWLFTVKPLRTSYLLPWQGSHPYP